mmetsp:Transcript_23343/g.69955  ORF Transcript_23343/g.69955 Transcript_23343/m.69955 type:complete len:308 (+) Transcript_23343:2-925(+)
MGSGGWIRFSKDYWDKIKRGEVQLGKNQDRSAGVMSKIIAQLWHDLDHVTKTNYQEAHMVETEEYNKVMAEWRSSRDVLEYDERLRKWQEEQKQRDEEAKIKREKAAAAARANALLAGTTIPQVDYINAYKNELKTDRPMATGPPYTLPAMTSAPVDRLDTAIDRLTRAAKFPGEQWAQSIVQRPYSQSVHAAAKARYRRNDAHMREIFCRKVDVDNLAGSAAVPDPETTARVEAALLDAIKRTCDDIDELKRDGPPKRRRTAVEAGVADTDESLIIEPLLRVDHVLHTVQQPPPPQPAAGSAAAAM